MKFFKRLVASILLLASILWLFGFVLNVISVFILHQGNSFWAGPIRLEYGFDLSFHRGDVASVRNHTNSYYELRYMLKTILLAIGGVMSGAYLKKRREGNG
jgi:hypothetical protein